MSREVINEYKNGMNDPSREVGRIEKSRMHVKKFIERFLRKS